jgi:hypothetical protein
MNKYRIRKMADERLWLEPFSPAPGWWLYRPDGKVRSLLTWERAILAMDLDAAKSSAKNNRVLLGPIGTVPRA